jgi:hypothetical protein
MEALNCSNVFLGTYTMILAGPDMERYEVSMGNGDLQEIKSIVYYGDCLFIS